MSKSLKNFYTIREVIEKGYDPIAIRLLMLQSHYRSSVNFSWENLDAAVNRLVSLRAMADRRFQSTNNTTGVAAFDLANSQQVILEALQNDLNTPEALAEISKLADVIEGRGLMHAAESEFKEFLAWLDDLLGLRLLDTNDITSEQKELIIRRQKARSHKDWRQSDALRDALADQGIAVRDTADGPIWHQP